MSVHKLRKTCAKARVFCLPKNLIRVIIKVLQGHEK